MGEEKGERNKMGGKKKNTRNCSQTQHNKQSQKNKESQAWTLLCWSGKFPLKKSGRVLCLEKRSSLFQWKNKNFVQFYIFLLQKSVKFIFLAWVSCYSLEKMFKHYFLICFVVHKFQTILQIRSRPLWR